MVNEADISETALLLTYGDKVCANLLKDHTTQQNIYWATDSYASALGEGYTFYDPITIEKITGDNGNIIRPRAVKSREEQTQRSKDKAEVFTPSWICNAQNNLIDEQWFGRKEGLFNRPDPEDPHRWIDNTEKIAFPDTEGKTWRDYVADTRLEITCGEAPYLANRYDVVTGEYNSDALHRIGLLDRKLRIVSENARDSQEWILWGKIALRSTYGFEWQGDNLLLAREALFYTFAEHYTQQFGEKAFNKRKGVVMPGVAYIVSWNVWQMDGMTYGLPGYKEQLQRRIALENQYRTQLDDYHRTKAKMQEVGQNSLFPVDEQFILPLQEPAKPAPPKPFERFCLVKDFLDGVNIHRKSLKTQNFHDKRAPWHTFESLLNK